MPKIKLAHSSPHIDMTPMVDLFSVLLTFLMMTTQMRQQEPVTVDTPYSISEKPTPDFNMMTFLVGTDNRVFMNFDNGPDTLLKFRPKILVEMGKHYGIEFTEAEQIEFENYPAAMGVPINRMKEFLHTQEYKEREAFQTGIPIDSTDNQLAYWILFARQVNPNFQACIKGDSKTEFPLVKKVLDILQDKNVNKFNLVTSLEATKINLEEIQQ
ncbi:MAG TPA: biopolymer transporter ExbD [Bacteroidales bacterium]|nr:biopolymer transporter ExbD [Bacteroidales bacterium]